MMTYTRAQQTATWELKWACRLALYIKFDCDRDSPLHFHITSDCSPVRRLGVGVELKSCNTRVATEATGPTQPQILTT